MRSKNKTLLKRSCFELKIKTQQTKTNLPSRDFKIIEKGNIKI